MAWAQQRHQVVDRGPDLTQVGLDMWENDDGVPMVMTMSSARAASAARSTAQAVPAGAGRLLQSLLQVPASANGIRPERTESRIAWS